ncbi:MAG: L-arabinose ABC transporter, permease protein AraH, partial [uncultured Blastococcus sp.]
DQDRAPGSRPDAQGTGAHRRPARRYQRSPCPGHAQPADQRYLRRVRRHRRVVRVPHRRRLAEPRQHHQHRPPVLLHPGAGDRHGPGDHRRPHRPVGRIGGRAHRRGLGRPGDPAGLPVVGGHARRPRCRPGGRRMAGLLGGLRRHPRVHRDPRRHARVPRPHAAGARQHLALAVRRALHRRRQWLPQRAAGWQRLRRLHAADRRRGRRRLRGQRFPHAAGPDQVRAAGGVLPAVRGPRGGRRCGRHVLRLAAGARARPADRADHPRRPDHHLRGDLQPHRVRPSDLRHRRQPGRGAAVRRQGEGRQLLDLREHGFPGRRRRDHLLLALQRRPAVGGQHVRARRHRRRLHRRRGSDRRRGHCRRRHGGRPARGRHEQRHAADGRRAAGPVDRQGPRPAPRRRLRRLQQAPSRDLAL